MFGSISHRYQSLREWQRWLLLALFIGFCGICWSEYPHPFVRFFWRYDFPSGVRRPIAEIMVATNFLKQKNEKEVRELLAFGRSGDNASFDQDGNLSLRTSVSDIGDFSGRLYFINFKNGKVDSERIIGGDEKY